MEFKEMTMHFRRREDAKRLREALARFEVKSIYLYDRDWWIRSEVMWGLYPLVGFWGKLSMRLKLAFRKLTSRYTAVLHAYGSDRETKTAYDLTCFFHKPFRPVLWDGSGYNMVYVGHVEKIYEKGLEVEVEDNEVWILIPPDKWMGYINRLLLGWETLCRGEKTSA